MIDKALHLLREELNAYFVLNGTPSGEVLLDNVGFLQTEDGRNLRNKLIVTLVNVEEESALKNGAFLRRSLNGPEYVSAPVHLNLYLLFSAYYLAEAGEGPLDRGYVAAWQRLSLVIQFFQVKNHFTLGNSPAFLLTQPGALLDPDYVGLKLFLDLYTLSFEQINHLWASLGGRQVPFILYKARLAKVQARNAGEPAPLIETVETRVSPLTEPC